MPRFEIKVDYFVELNNKCDERKIAVLTGSGGYIGHNLNSYLLANGWETVLLVRLGSEASFGSPFIEGNCQILAYDGTQNSLASLQFRPGADVVFFHLAAYSEVGALSDTERFIDSNIRFGIHLLEYMVKNKYRNFVFAESYWQFDSEGRLGGNTLYAATKSAFSLLAEYYSKDVRINSLVLYDVYGPCDFRGKIVNVLLNSAVTKSPVNLTLGEQFLDYVHIDDVVRAFELAGLSLLSLANNRQRKFCRSTVRTMEVRKLKEFVEILGRAVGHNPNVRWGVKPYPAYQIMIPWFPSEKFQLTGWQPKYTFLSGLKSIINNEQNKTNDLHSKLQ